MARITCRTPSTGKGLHVKYANVPTTFTSIIDAPDFSVPDAAEFYSNRDPSDAARAIRPGEILFLTPMSVRNKGATTQWLEVVLETEDSVTIELAKISVPAGDTGYVPIQGRSLFKRAPSGTTGDAIKVRAQTANTFDIWVSVEEKLSSEHAGVV